MFEDMGNTLGSGARLTLVNGRNALGAEEDLPPA
jgi:hypothetical protein